MSRAINVNATETEVSALCKKRGVTISAIEALVSGGTRVVFMNMVDTNAMHLAFGRKVLTTPVRRTPLSTWQR